MARKTKEQAQETRNTILDAAEAVFQERGVSNTSLAEIASEAGVTRGAIYWHFENKTALFEAMIQRVFDPLEAMLANLRAHESENPVDALRDIAVYFLERVASEPQFLRVLEISWHKCEYVGEMATIRNNHLECGNRYLSINEAGFKLACERGFLPQSLEPRQAAVGLMSIVDGLVVNWTLDNTLFPLASFGPPIVDAYLRGLKEPQSLPKQKIVPPKPAPKKK
ncbi:TetR family transcriptional regulator [Sulfurirhabdus autotrophica]|uniref:TetR family transcriptional regulator n=1 Tax=Sulfurirhabdus autotrophica TaxID=1706046 RepID=A0A4R3YIR7_9PROT|nr:TetR family transcriptional regulator [Sulfurirhabdus autotrophica]TCV90573.1 TetR family transcriptional regulator [Sulfurirhabdus autotrophica]